MTITETALGALTTGTTSPLSGSVTANIGQTIILLVQAWSDTADGTVTSSNGSDVVTKDGASTDHLFQVFRIVVGGSNGARTITWTSGAHPTAGCTASYTVLSSTNALAVDIALTKNVISSATSTPTTSSITPSGTGRLLVAGFAGDNGGYTAGTPTNSFLTVTSPAGVTENPWSYRIYASATAISTGWTITSHTDTGNAMIMAYKEAGASPLNLAGLRGATSIAAARVGKVSCSYKGLRGASTLAATRAGSMFLPAIVVSATGVFTGTTSPLSGSITVTDGSAIILLVQAWSDTADGTVTSSVPGDVVTKDGASTDHVFQVFRIVCAGTGARTITWTSGAHPTAGCYADYLVTTPASHPVLAAALATATISVATATPATPAITPTSTGQLLVGAFAGDNGNYTITGGPTNSFTGLSMPTGVSENPTAYRVDPTASTTSTGWTLSHTDTGESMVIAYKQATVGSLALTKQRGATTLAAARLGHLVVTTSRPPGLRGATTIAAGRLGQQTMRYPTGRAVSLATARAGHVTTAATVLNLTKQRGAMTLAAARAGTLQLTTYGYRLLTGLRGAVSSTAGRVGVLTRNNRMLPAQRGAASMTDSRLGVAFLSNNAAITVLVRAEDHVSVTIREES